MADTTPMKGELTGSVMFFKKPEPLSAERHGSLGLRRMDAPLAFAREAHVVPVTVGEFASAALSYPVIFATEKKTPLVVMGLRAGQNLYIDKAGALETDRYLPAFIRRYPFVLAENKGQDGFVVCVDAESDLVTSAPDVPFFQDGKPSDFTNDAIDFLKNFENQRQLTERLTALLDEHELFETKTVSYRPRNTDGSLADPVTLAEYFAVSMDKLNALPAETLVQLRDNGALNAIYVHNVSLLNWKMIVERALRQPSAVAADA